ncbi:Multidrug resistance protein B [Bacillus thuringiensis serovar israelensis ATCC 35646]|nr:Multidrug resistance protein B [Bacillus thuringiensis serovar israelensis ATCC 35646]
MLFTILGVGCIISGFVYLLLDRLIENRSKQIPIKQTS